MRCVPTTGRVWEHAARLARALEQRGTPIPAQDSLIAAHALQAGAAVLTLDTDYRRIPGLVVLTRLTRPGEPGANRRPA
jgi:predicted nucleic acid-binding protein